MEKVNKVFILFFVLGLAIGMIVAGIYNVYEFRRANKELIELKTTCECKKLYPGFELPKSNLNASIGFNFT